MAKTRVVREDRIDTFFENLKKQNAGKPTVLLGTNIAFTKENWEASQEKGLRELAEYRKKTPIKAS